MELREFGERVLLSPSVEEKLAPPPGDWSDERPGNSVRLSLPEREDSLRFSEKKRGARMPSLDSLRQPSQRAIAHHIMANHELQALEVMAWVLCAFPDAPPAFRIEVADVMRDEQRHCAMHIRRSQALGLDFGAAPVNGYVWKHAMAIDGLLDYLACLPLTFEGGNLDHSLEFAERFRSFGDAKSAAVMDAIHRDEIVHVALGVRWLRQLKPAGQSEWDAYVAHLHLPLGADDAKGKEMNREARRLAGMDDDFIDRLAQVTKRQRNRPRPPAAVPLDGVRTDA